MVKYSKAQQATDDNIIQRMRCACRITKATDTHLVYVVQQWLNKTFLIVLFIRTLPVLF